MDFITLVSYVLAIVETCALMAALVYYTRAMHEKKSQRAKQGKKGAKSQELTKAVVSGYYRNAGLFFAIYLVLTILRRFSGIFE